MTDSEGQVNGHSVYSIGPVDPMVFLFCSLVVVVSAREPIQMAAVICFRVSVMNRI